MTGVSGGEFGIRGFVDAYDAETGEQIWRTYTIPAPGEPGSETWPGDTWQTGGGPIWITGNYDVDNNVSIGASATRHRGPACCGRVTTSTPPR
jgi:alcohol dehydrogenase (cytochrome c)